MFFQKLKSQFRELHPALKGILLMGLASLTVLFYLFSGHGIRSFSQEARFTYYLHGLDSPEGVTGMVIVAPFIEEIKYRGPVWLIMLLTSALAARFSKKQLIETAGFILATATLVGLTLFWALGHRFPITVFCYGLVWGYVLIATRSIIYPILFHAGSNAIAVIGIMALAGFRG